MILLGFRTHLLYRTMFKMQTSTGRHLRNEISTLHNIFGYECSSIKHTQNKRYNIIIICVLYSILENNCRFMPIIKKCMMLLSLGLMVLTQ